MAHRGRQNADSRLLTALAGGLTVESAAAAADVSARTAHRRLADPDFARRVEVERGRLVEITVARLAAAGVDAVEKLRALLAAESLGTQLGAARAMLEFLLRGHEQIALMKRVEELERQVSAGGSP